MLLLKGIAHIIEQQLIKVVAAKLSVAVAGEDLDDAVLDLGDRDIKRAASQVVDQEPFGFAGMGVVGQHGRGRFVDDANDLQPGELTCLASRLALAVVEEGGHGDHGLGHGVSQRLLGPVLERPEDDRRNFLGPVLFVSQG